MKLIESAYEIFQKDFQNRSEKENQTIQLLIRRSNFIQELQDSRNKLTNEDIRQLCNRISCKKFLKGDQIKLYDNFHIIIGGSLTHYIDEFYVDIDELIKFSEEEKESPKQ